MSGDSRYLVPKWTSRSAENIFEYFNQLEAAYKTGLFNSEHELIFSSIMLSPKQDLLGQLPSEAKQSLEEYKSFMMENFAPSHSHRKRLFRSISQSPGEELVEYWFRVNQAYKNSRFSSLQILNDDDKNEICLKFVDGLRNREIRRVMLLDDDLSFESCLKRARHVESALSE